MQMITRSTIALLALIIGVYTAPLADAATATEIDANVASTVTSFYQQVKSGKELANKAVAMLVFPEVYKAGFGIGGEYGEGAMLQNGQTTGYYNTIAASVGFQIGAQVKSQVIMFMTKGAVKDFETTEGWKAGVDGSVALVKVGAGGDIDTNTINSPIIGFIFSNKGLMFNLTFEGAKITKVKK